MRAIKLRLNLGLKLLLIFLIVGLIPLIVTGGVNILLTSNTLRDRAFGDEQAYLQRKANEIERFLSATGDDVFLLSQSVAVREMSQAIVNNNQLALQPARETTATEFQNFVAQRKFGDQRVYARIRFLTTDGFEFVRVDDVDGKPTVSMNLNFRNNEGYFSQAIGLPEGEIYISPINLFDEYGRIQQPYTPVLQYSTPVYSDEKLVGVLVMDIQAQGFLDLVQADLPSKATAFLVDQEGYYLSDADPAKLYGRDLKTGISLPSDRPALSEVLNTPQDGTTELGGNIVVYQRIVPPGQEGRYWMLFSLRPLNTVLSSVRQQQNTLELALLLVGIVVAGIALYFARGLSRPIVQLTETSTLIADGNLNQRVQIARDDEIGDLARTFNSMADQLRGSIDHLEDRVNARTRDLQIAADVSRQLTTVLDIDRLLQQVATLTATSYDLYASFVFLPVENGKRLIQAAGADSSGALLKLEGFDGLLINAQPSIVALAARSCETVTVNNTLTSPLYLHWDALPDTRSEVAIPLMLGDRLLGVFDLQSRQTNRFDEEDLRILTSLAEQIAIAVRNAQLFEETKAAREAAEQANKVKSQFLANMSHELRTPLNAILNFTGFVADGVLGPVNEKQADSLNKVVNSSQHLLSLINDILDLTKIEVGMMDLFIQDVDMNAALESSVSTAKGLVKDKPIQLITDIEKDLPVIMGDRRRIRQVLLNLISNAVKFTPEGSVTISASRKDGDILITVSDTGIGIPADQTDTVFESFKQAKHDLPENPGTGLGMPISKAFVEAHGGKIWFESRVGVGTTFYVTLPIAATEVEAAAPKTEGTVQAS
jgi:signal transduction histidine kinase